MKPYIVTLTGPSCSGKSTLEAHLLNKGFAKVISTTTRPMRDGEVNGVDYYFTPKEEFERMIQWQGFIENIVFGDHHYGVTIAEIERIAALNKPIVIVVEPAGREQIENYCESNGFNLRKVFLNTNKPEIAKRFINRLSKDILGAITTSEVNKICDNYAKRMLTMTTSELSWGREACSLSSPYDRKLSAYDLQGGGESLAVKELVTGARANGFLQ